MGQIPPMQGQNGHNKALNVTKMPSQASGKGQAKTPRQANPSPKREQAEAFFRGKCRRCGSTMHTMKDCKVASDVECRNCKKTEHLAKICASHIFNPLWAQQQERQKMMANIIEQGENSSSDDEGDQAQALAISQRVRNASPVTISARGVCFLGGQHA